MKASELRQSILQAAVQGKLVPQNVHDEPAVELLKRIRQEKTRLAEEGKIKKEKPLLPITEDEIPFDLPDGWVWCRLGTVADHSLGKMLDSQKNKGVNQKYLRNQNVQWFHFDLLDLKEMKIDQSEQERYSVSKGDLIICEGGYPGTSAIWEEESSIFFQKALHRVRFFLQGMNYYFHYCLYLSALSGDLNRYYTGSGIQHFTGYSLNRFVFPLPPLSEQQRIVVKLNELMTLCDELEAAEEELNALENRFTEYLPKSILQAAVRGKLVSQNVHDEPASELLKRIWQERARLIKEGKIKKEKPLPLVTKDEIPYDLPVGWVWCKIGDIANIYTGNSINGNDKKTKYTGLSEGYFYVATKDIGQDNYINYENGIVIPFDNTNFRIAPAFSVLLCIEGGSAGKKIAITNQDVCFVNKLCCFSSYILDSKYLFYYLKSPVFSSLFQSCMTGIIGGVGVNSIKKLLFVLPPLAEQQRIIAKLDELMAMCDELKDSRNIPIKPVVSNVVPFQPKEKWDELLIAARGDASQGLSDKAQHDVDELLGD